MLEEFKEARFDDTDVLVGVDELEDVLGMSGIRVFGHFLLVFEGVQPVVHFISFVAEDGVLLVERVEGGLGLLVSGYGYFLVDSVHDVVVVPSEFAFMFDRRVFNCWVLLLLFYELCGFDLIPFCIFVLHFFLF